MLAFSYHDALSDLCFDDRTQDAEMLFYLPTDVRRLEATIHVTSENHLGELSFSVYLPRLFLPPVSIRVPCFS